MRIAFVLVLLLTVSVRPVWAQDTHLSSPLQTLPASLAPVASAASAPLDLSLHQRNRGLGGFVGAIVGGGVMLLAVIAITSDGGSHGDGAPVFLAAIGLGTVVGAVAGAIIGLPDGSPPRN
jgi:hypothetical protein